MFLSTNFSEYDVQSQLTGTIIAIKYHPTKYQIRAIALKSHQGRAIVLKELQTK